MNKNLKIVEKIEVGSFLKTMLPQTAIDLYNAIESKGFQVFLVGGLPRYFAMEYLVKKEGLDLKLNSAKELEELDVDFSTNASYDEIQTIVDEMGLKGTTGGREFLVFHVEGYQVATYRKEVSYERDGIPVREQGSLEEDYSTRDFSINSLYMTLDGEIYDFVGGIQDIRNKVLKSIGDSMARLNEDSSRALRVFDFATRYDLTIATDLLEAVKSNQIKEKAKLMPNSMKGKMLKKFIKHGTLSKAFKKFQEEDMLEVFFPQFSHLVGAYQNKEYHHLNCFDHVMATVEAAEKIAPNNELIQLTMLWHDIAKNSEGRTFKNDDPLLPQDLNHEEFGALQAIRDMKDYQFGREFAKEVGFLVHWHGLRFGGSDIKNRTAVRYLRKLSQESKTKDQLRVRVQNLMTVIKCDSEGFDPLFSEKMKSDIEKMEILFFDNLDKLILFKEELPITARDLISWGFPAGPNLGAFLDYLVLESATDIERIQKLASNRVPNLIFN